jgi:hypothetical protein
VSGADRAAPHTSRPRRADQDPGRPAGRQHRVLRPQATPTTATNIAVRAELALLERADVHEPVTGYLFRRRAGVAAPALRLGRALRGRTADARRGRTITTELSKHPEDGRRPILARRAKSSSCINTPQSGRTPVSTSTTPGIPRVPGLTSAPQTHEWLLPPDITLWWSISCYAACDYPTSLRARANCSSKRRCWPLPGKVPGSSRRAIPARWSGS